MVKETYDSLLASAETNLEHIVEMTEVFLCGSCGKFINLVLVNVKLETLKLWFKNDFFFQSKAGELSILNTSKICLECERNMRDLID